jgi:hypothetical protein
MECKLFAPFHASPIFESKAGANQREANSILHSRLEWGLVAVANGLAYHIYDRKKYNNIYSRPD